MGEYEREKVCGLVMKKGVLFDPRRVLTLTPTWIFFWVFFCRGRGLHVGKDAGLLRMAWCFAVHFDLTTSLRYPPKYSFHFG